MTSEKIKVVMSRINSCNIHIPISVILCKNTRKLKKVLNRLHKHKHIKGIDYIWLCVDITHNNFLNVIIKRRYWMKISGNNKILLSNNINMYIIKSLKCTINNKYRKI